MEMGPGHLASSENMLCPFRRTADFEHEVAGAYQQTLIIFRGVAIGRNYGTARVAGFVYFGEEIESTCFRLAHKQVISVLFAYMAFIVHFTDRFRHFFGELGCGVII